MNKGNLNKLVTNYPVELTEEEIENLSGTLAPVIAACGGGGGGTGGKIYTGIGFVSVNNTTNQIGLTNEANTKLNQDIPTKVSDLTDSASYQTVAGMDEYLTSANAQTLYQTKDDMSAYLTKASATQNLAPISVTGDIEDLKSVSGDFNNYYTKDETDGIAEAAKDNAKSYAYNLSQLKQDKLTFEYDSNNEISSINHSALAGQGGTTYSAGQYINIDANDTISVTGVLALDEYAQYEPVLIGDANITATSSKVDSHTQWNLAINSTPVVTDTKLVGENCVTAHTTTISGEWAVGLVQTAYEAIDSIAGISTDVGTLKTASANWNEVSAKLDSSVASTTYQPKGNYASASDISDMATKTWVGQQGYLTTVPDTYALKTDLNTASSTLTGVDNALSGHIDYVSSHAITSLDNYYTKTQVDSTFASATQLNDYLTTAKYQTDSATFALKTETSSKTEITNALNTKVDKPTSMQTGKLVYDGDTSAWVSMPAGTTTIVQGTNGISAEYDNVNTYTVGLSASYKAQIEAVSSKLNKADADTYYAPISITGDVNTLTAASAGWNNKVDKPTSLVDKYLVLRTDSNGDVSGWCDFQDQSYSKSEANGTFVATANIDNTTLSGDGKSVSTKLGVKTDVIATKDYVNSSFLPLSGGTVSGDVIVSSSGTCLLTVGTEATLMGQSRVVNMGDTTARGTNWLGVTQSNNGFLKYVNGGNVGALNGTSIQIDFAPDGANSYGNITVNSQDNVSKVVHVPTASYNSMSSFDNTNGPNYMLRKTASGFDIGAAVINVTTLPSQTEANTYYFIYDT